MAKLVPININLDDDPDVEAPGKANFRRIIYEAAIAYITDPKEYEKYLPHWAKLVGMSVKEFDAIVRETVTTIRDVQKQRQKEGRDYDNFGDPQFEDDIFEECEEAEEKDKIKKNIHSHMPWKTAISALEMGSILDEMVGEINKYVKFTNDTDADMAALWSVSTFGFVIKIWHIFPRLMISALDPECGKTNLMEIISHITYDGYLCDRGTVSSILLAIDTYRPTLLLDEAGRYLKDMFFRETINSGYQRGKLVMKTKNNGQEFVVYEVFTPIVLGGLKLWDTLAEDTQTRCLKIILDKSEKVGEVPHIKHLDTTKLDILAQKAAKFVLDNLQKLRDYDLPSREGRLGNNWEPLFAVAEAVGNGWVERATLAMERAKQTNSKHKTEWVRYLSFTRDWFILNPKQDKIWVIAHQG